MGRGASGGQFSWHCNSVRICFDGGIDSFGHMELVCVTFSSALGHFEQCFEQIFLGQDVIVYSVLRGNLRKKGGHARMSIETSSSSKDRCFSRSYGLGQKQGEDKGGQGVERPRTHPTVLVSGTNIEISYIAAESQ